MAHLSASLPQTIRQIPDLLDCSSRHNGTNDRNENAFQEIGHSRIRLFFFTDARRLRVSVAESSSAFTVRNAEANH